MSRIVRHVKNCNSAKFQASNKTCTMVSPLYSVILAAILVFGVHLGFWGEIVLALYQDKFSIPRAANYVPMFMLLTKIEQWFHPAAALCIQLGLMKIAVFGPICVCLKMVYIKISKY